MRRKARSARLPLVPRAFFAVILIATGCGSAGSVDINQLFADLENGIRRSDGVLFRKHWDPQGYRENLVGRSGLAGSRIFEQGSRKRWFLNPDLSKTVRQGKVEIFTCEVYAWEKNRSVDRLYLAVADGAGGPRVLGGGEDLAEVKALADRFNEGRPLAPDD